MLSSMRLHGWCERVELVEMRNGKAEDLQELVALHIHVGVSEERSQRWGDLEQAAIEQPGSSGSDGNNLGPGIAHKCALMVG